MAVYSIVEFVIERPANWPMFLLHHVLHVALIGVAVWIASLMVIRRFVIRPANHIFVHLRQISAGRLEYLHCAVRASELSEVVTSLNDLVAKLRRTPEPDAISRALDHLRNLRAGLRSSAAELGDDIVPVMRLVTALEGDLLEILQLAGADTGAVDCAVPQHSTGNLTSPTGQAQA